LLCQELLFTTPPYFAKVSIYETCRMTYDLLNGTSGTLIDSTDSTDLEIASKNNAVLFVNNLTYKPKKDLVIARNRVLSYIVTLYFYIV
ncbi:hypothetical protein, partial [Alloprevotella tannerae]|uniref:hypothetical protein n=1 Tax=Alloprevotella tannerae TaxID=76122 RepID=UPI0028D1A980